LLGCVVLLFVFLDRVRRSPFGRVLKAIREDELVAKSLGKDTARFKIKSFMLGCALMGLGGILWQMRQGAITPNAFRPKVTFYVWVALIIGGAGSNTGSVMGGAIFAAVLFEGPRYVKNVVVQRFTDTIPDAPATFAAAVGPLVDPLLVFDTQLLNAVPILAFLGVVYGVWTAGKMVRRRYATDVGGPVHSALAEVYDTDSDPAVIGDRILMLATVLVLFVPWAALLATGGDALPFVAYALGNINSLQLVIMGLVLVWLIQVRPEGMLGHRKEVASGVPLLDAEGRAVRPEPKSATTDGGEAE
jgi:branched-subunit amino acid ABC-type transport system permease component